MRFGKIVIVGLTVISLFLSGCDSSANDRVPDAGSETTILSDATSEVPSTPTVREPDLIVVSYVSQEAGDGWNNGRVSLAFENQDEEYLPSPFPLESVGAGYYDTRDAYVETVEGKTYPVEVSSHGEDNFTRKGRIDISRLPPIPPGFTIEGGTTFGFGTGEFGSNYAAWGNLVVRFKFAQAAHPTRIVFPSNPRWNIDLTGVTNRRLINATDAPKESFEHLDVLAGEIISDNETSTIMYIGCRKGGYLDLDRYLAISVTNKDALDQITVQVVLPAHAIIREEQWPSGTGKTEYAVRMNYSDETQETMTIGPGSTEITGIRIGDTVTETKYLVLYSATENRIFRVDLDKCGEE